MENKNLNSTDSVKNIKKDAATELRASADIIQNRNCDELTRTEERGARGGNRVDADLAQGGKRADLAQGRDCSELTKKEVMNLAMEMGKILLTSGAETSRVEETMTRFCRGYGYDSLNVFCTPTCIIFGEEISNGQTMLARIHSRVTDLGLIIDINDLSYNFKVWRMNFTEAKKWIREKLEASHPYGSLTVSAASGLGSASFSLLLNGTVNDFFAAFATGFFAMYILKKITYFKPSAFWENCIAGFAIGMFGMFFSTVDSACTLEKISVGAVMPFVPGVPFTNGVRDFIAGDLVSGTSRVAEAILFAISIAVGLAFAIKIWIWGAGIL